MYDKILQHECLFGGHFYLLLHKLLRNIYFNSLMRKGKAV